MKTKIGTKILYDNIVNLIKIIIWVTAFSKIHKWVLQTIKIYDVKEITDASYAAYVNNMQTMVGIAAGLAIIWWGISLIPSAGREFIENSAGIWAVISVLLYFVIAVLSSIYIPGVIREGGTLKSLHYVFVYPCIYTAVLYAAPPDNICRIITPCRGIFRIPIIAVICLCIVLSYIL